MQSETTLSESYGGLPDVSTTPQPFGNYVELDTKLSNSAFLEDLAIISMQNEP
jgi:hypothetical protein